MSDELLERPYTVAAVEDYQHEQFQETDLFNTVFVEWVCENPDVIVMFERTDAYRKAFEDWLEGEGR